MENKELVEKIYADVNSAPEKAEVLKVEVNKVLVSIQSVIETLIIDNIHEVAKIEKEEQFYDFIALLVDKFLVLPPIAEQLDYTIAKFILKNVVDKILDKYAGGDWFVKFMGWIKDIIAKNNLIKDIANA